MDRNHAGHAPFAIVLGIMQDAALPHIACLCSRCIGARRDPRQRRYTASLALVDPRDVRARVWLIDATPDIGWQLDLLAPWLGTRQDEQRLRQPDGIFLTHGHMGHTGGLVQLGPEAMNVQALPLYGPGGLIRALESMALWQPLRSNLLLTALDAGEPLYLGDDLLVTPLAVPHRDEAGTGTFAYRLQGPRRSLLYVPDIDRWESWRAARREIGTVDVALLDGSFFDAEELGRIEDVPHPLVTETIAFCRGMSTKVVLTHFNHTNTVLEPGSEARKVVEVAGLSVARQGQRFSL